MPKRQRAETTPDSGVPLVWSGLGYKTEALIKLVRIGATRHACHRRCQSTELDATIRPAPDPLRPEW